MSHATPRLRSQPPLALRRSASALGLACLLSTGWSHATLAESAAPELRSALLAEAQRWSDKSRTDIARQKIAKLLAMEPNSPEGLAFLGDLALRDNKPDEARTVLERMRAQLPQHPATQALEQVYAVYTQQREKLARMRLMVRAGRSADAATLARELFPQGAPRYGTLGQEIARASAQRGGAGNAGDTAQATAPAAPTALASATAARKLARPRTNSATTTAATTLATAAARTRAAATGLATDGDDDAPLVLRVGDDELPSALANLARLTSARADQLRAEAATELQAEHLSPALRLLEDALQQTPADAWLRYDLARLYIRLQQPQQARAVADEGLALRPTDTDMRYAHALLLGALNDDSAALADLQHIAPAERSVGMQALELRLQHALRAQRLDAQLEAARQHSRDGQFGAALALFQQAQQSVQAAAQAGDPVDAPVQDGLRREIQAIETRRVMWLEAGQQTLEKNSSEGLGSLRGWERPLVAWLPWGYQGTLFVHADQVQLDAGSYAGGEPFAQPGSQAITSGLPQRADGLNLGVGYVGDRLRWDLGETGIGFAVPNWVGGLRYGGEIGALDYSVELARRPLTGTLLSYAGAYDPQTHAAWGGVVATGVGARLATDIGPYSASFSTSLASLSGRNVADNSRLKWRLAADRDIYQDAQQALNLGLVLSGTYHDKDLSGYTWGHGGYYSPVRNLTLSLPLEWSGRSDAFTWQLKTSASLSSSASNASDYYPGNAAMQQQSGGVYAASSSTGSGWSLAASGEYQLAPHLALGARLEREVSDFYTPLNLLLYARYEFDPVRQPLARRPRPVQAYSQF